MTDRNILADENAAKREEIVDLLTPAYWMEIETVTSYIAELDQPRRRPRRGDQGSLATDINEELGHAQQFAERIKDLYGMVPGSKQFGLAEVSPAAGRPDRRRARHQGRDRGRAGRDQPLQQDHRVATSVDPVTADMVTTSWPTRRATCASSRGSSRSTRPRA